MKGNINRNSLVDRATLENVKVKLSQQINALPSALFSSPKQKQLQDYQSMELKSPGSNFMTSRGSTTNCDSNFKSVGVLSTSSMSLAGTTLNSPTTLRNHGRRTIFNQDTINPLSQSKSSNHTRHVSILTGGADNNKLGNTKLKQQSQPFEDNSYMEQSEAAPAKIRIKSSTQTASQVSLGSRDISTAAECQYQNESTQPHSYQGSRPDSSIINIKPIQNNILKRNQQSFDITEEESPFNQNQHLISPTFHSQTNSRHFNNTQRFTSSVYFQSIEHDYRPKTSSKNNTNIKSTTDLKQRPQTGVLISEFNCRRRKNIENIQKFQQVNTLENKKKLESTYTRPMTASSRGQSTPKDTQKGSKKRNSCFRSSLFEDEKLLKAFQQQMQKAVDKISNSSPVQAKNCQFFAPSQPIVSNFTNCPLQITIKPDPHQHQTLQQSPHNVDLGSTNFSGVSNNTNTLGNNLLNLPTSATPSSITLLESGKNSIRIIQELEAEMRMEQKDFVQHLISPEQRPIVYMAAFQKIEKLIEIKDIVLLAENLLFLAHLAALVDDQDNACFFLVQTKIMSDMSRKIGEMKPQIFIQFGDLCIKTGRYTQALSFYKKALQYAWFYNQNDVEVLLFEKLGVTYFYMQDVVLSDFYHTRFISSLNEFQDSHHRNISQENIAEYNLKLEYNLTSITPILMVHMQLPVQYSVDKAAHSLRESFLKTQMINKKRASNVGEQLSSLFRESQQEVENFQQSRMKVFKMANADKIIQQLLVEDREFTYQMSTPTFFAHPEDEDGKDENVPIEVAACQRDFSHKKVDMLIHHSMSVFTTQDSRKKKKEWVAPIMKKTAYDVSKLGPVSDPRPSQRVFEDPTKYKLSLEKKIAVLAKQKIDYNSIMQKVSNIVSNNQKFHEAMHQRVRVSHVSPNRFDPLKYNTPFYTINQVNRAYSGFMLKLLKWKDQKSKEIY